MEGHAEVDTPLTTAIGVLAVGLLMVLPVVAIGFELEPDAGAISPVATSATAALGVLFRASARNLLRGTLMTTIRATSRTVSRRVARRGLQILGSFLIPGRNQASEVPAQNRWLALTMGVAVVVGSFWGVLAWTETDLGSPLPWLLSGAAAPLIVHFVAIHVFARLHGIGVTYATTLDGVLLQAYFTLAGSFLPLASDADLDGPDAAKARVAGYTLGVLWLCGVACMLGTREIPELSGVASFFLIYAFVFSFPLQPLDGGDVFRRSKLAWLIGFLGILSTFAWHLPEAWYALL